jgi:Protein of unknown function (DUF3223)
VGILIADLLYDGRHPETLEKIGDGIDHIKVGRASHNTRCFWIVHTDGSEVDFSVNTAMSGQPSPKARVSAAPREEISGQISAYRRDQPETVRCALCNLPAIREEAFVTYLAQPLTKWPRSLSTIMAAGRCSPKRPSGPSARSWSIVTPPPTGVRTTVPGLGYL